MLHGILSFLNWFRWFYVELVLFYLALTIVVLGCVSIAFVILWRMARK